MSRLHYPVVNLPDYFTHLLRIDISSIPNFPSYLNSYFHEYKGVWALVKQGLKDLDPDPEVDHLVRLVGWGVFRNRLANLLIHYFTHREIPENEGPNYMEEILFMERNLLPLCVDGYSRVFLLGFYLKMAELTFRKDRENSLAPSMFDEGLLKLIPYMKSKVIKMDWILIMLAHFDAYLGRERLMGALASGEDYQKLFLQLSEEDKEHMLSNMLSYGQSIGESEIFITKPT